MALAYETGTASNQAAIMEALHDFAVAQGWTSNIYSSANSWMAINNGTVFVQFRWNNSNVIVPFHSTGFAGTGTAPGNHPGDDGMAVISAGPPYTAAANNQRRITIGNGPYTSYHFFADDDNYIHAVIEESPGVYAHLSFGMLQKVGDWEGGNYLAHSRWDTTSATPDHFLKRFLWDAASQITGTGALATNWYRDSASVRVKGMPNQSGDMQWMLFNRSTTQTMPNDRAGNAIVRGLGGCRGGPLLGNLGKLRSNLLNGYIPVISIPIFWWNQVPNPSEYMLLGYAPNCGQINMADITPGQEFTVGGKTWKVFPMRSRTFSGDDQSRHGGMAYLKDDGGVGT